MTTLNRELQLRGAVGRFWNRSVSFSLENERDSRGKLQIGDIIYARDENTDTQMGLLVVKGGAGLTEGWSARCKTLFYLSAGQIVNDTGGVIFHDERTILEPRIDFATASLKPMDRLGNSHVFHPTEAKILRPTHPRLKEAFDKYKLYQSAADKLFYASSALLGVSSVREISMAASTHIDGGAILFDLGWVASGVAAYKMSDYFRGKAQVAFSEYAKSYSNIMGGRNLSIAKTIYSAFTT